MLTTQNSHGRFTLILLILYFIISPACKKDECSADFSISKTNGGMAPDTVMVDATDGSQDSYTWDQDGFIDSGTPQTFYFQTSGNYNLSLEVKNGENSCNEGTVIEIRDYPTEGFVTEDGQELGRVISYFEANGTLNTQVLGVQTARARIIPAGDPINIGGIGGLDFDDANKRLYVTPNFPGGGVTIGSCFPNGEDLKLPPGTDDFGITDLEVDDENQVAYYTIRFGGTTQIKVIGLDGSNPTTLISTGEIHDLDIAFDKKKQFFYWSTGRDNLIRVFDLELQVQDASPFGATDSETKHALKFDNSTCLLYYSQFNDVVDAYNIYQVDPNDLGSAGVSIVENASQLPVSALTIDEQNQELFWADRSTKTINRVNLKDLSDKEVVVNNVAEPRGIAVGVFWP